MKLIDGLWFTASEWGLPSLFFSEFQWDPSIDHSWHEFISLALDNDEISEFGSIESFLQRVDLTKLPY